MRRFVVIGQKASASPEFSLLDLPGTSGRIDVLVRCIRAALLVSHGLRRDTVLYLVLLGGERAPRSLRIEGASGRFIRPDERGLGALVQKSLAATLVRREGEAFAPFRQGVAVADGGLDVVLADIGPCPLYILDAGAPDIRELPIDPSDAVFVLGDHLGFDDATRRLLASHGAVPVSIGPLSVHAEDAITITANELDRRAASRRD